MLRAFATAGAAIPPMPQRPFSIGLYRAMTEIPDPCSVRSGDRPAVRPRSVQDHPRAPSPSSDRACHAAASHSRCAGWFRAPVEAPGGDVEELSEAELRVVRYLPNEPEGAGDRCRVVRVDEHGQDPPASHLREARCPRSRRGGRSRPGSADCWRRHAVRVSGGSCLDVEPNARDDNLREWGERVAQPERGLVV